jgi:hypothetical protein
MNCGKEKVRGKLKRNLGEPKTLQVVLMEYRNLCQQKRWLLTDGII